MATFQSFDEKTFNDARAGVIEASKLISGLMDYLKKSEKKGAKYR